MMMMMLLYSIIITWAVISKDRIYILSLRIFLISTVSGTFSRLIPIKASYSIIPIKVPSTCVPLESQQIWQPFGGNKNSKDKVEKIANNDNGRNVEQILCFV